MVSGVFDTDTPAMVHSLLVPGVSLTPGPAPRHTRQQAGTMTNPRHGRAWMQLLATCKATYPWVCHLCGQPIPHGLHRYHPLAYQADHIYPVKTHPWLALELTLLRPSHKQCNRQRSDRPLTPTLVAEITTKYGAPAQRAALAFFGLNRL